MHKMSPVTASERKRLECLVAQHGEPRTAVMVGVTLSALLRLLGGRTSVRPGTIALMRLGLAALDEEAAAAR
jgi:hypothetical protein